MSNRNSRFHGSGLPLSTSIATQPNVHTLQDYNYHADIFGYSAISDASKELAQRIHMLQIEQSPSSLEPQRSFTIQTKSLEECLFDALANSKILTSQVAMHMDPKLRENLFNQIDLIHEANEWDPDDIPVQESSFKTFLKAIVRIAPKRQPSLGLSDSGHLIASWVADKDRLIIEFFPNDRVQWVLTRYIDGEPERYAGESSVVRLADGLKPHNPEHWFIKSEEKKKNR